MSDCVGCGFCCSKSICIAGLTYHKISDQTQYDICPSLKWVDSENRHMCDLIYSMPPGTLKDDYMRELAIGAGCCMGLNDWRGKVKDRTQYNQTKYHNPLPVLMQKFINIIPLYPLAVPINESNFCFNLLIIFYI